MSTHLLAVDAVSSPNAPFIGLGIVVFDADGNQSAKHAIAPGHSRRSATVAGIAVALDQAAPALKAGDHIEILTVVEARDLLGDIDGRDPMMAQSAELLEQALQEIVNRGVAIALSRGDSAESKSLSEATRQAALGLLAASQATTAAMA